MIELLGATFLSERNCHRKSIFVSEGLKQLVKTQNIGLRKLLEIVGLNPKDKTSIPITLVLLLLRV